MSTKRFKTPFAELGDKADLPETITGTGAASYEQGFGPKYSEPYDEGGRDIPRDLFNGLMNDITGAVGELQKLGAAKWSQELAPYQKGAVVWHDDELWENTVANNSATAGGANWRKARITIGEISLPAGQVVGAVALANQLATARNLQVDLAETNAQAFNGSANATSIGARGTLPVSKGGTGGTTQASARSGLGLGSAATKNVGTSSGRLMGVGAFGLGNRISDATLNDLNGLDMNNLPESVNTAGFHGHSSGSAAANSPNGVATAYLFLNELKDSTFQIAMERGSDNYFMRAKKGAWNELTHSGNLRTSTGSSTKYPMTQKAVTDAINASAAKNTASKASRGWWKCGSTGVIVQWGNAGSIGVDKTVGVTFPIAFPSACVSASAQAGNNSFSGSGPTLQTRRLSKAGMTIACDHIGSNPTYWMAIGY